MVERQSFSVSLTRGPAPVSVRRDVDGVRIEARGARGLEPRLESTIDAFARERDAWADGFAIDTPWCPLALLAAEGGFVVQSPRFDDDPHAQRTSDLTVALTVAAGWERVRLAAAIEPVPVRFDDTMRAVVGWERCSMLTMTRVADAEPRDSGWFIEPHESEPGSLDVREQERLEAWMVQALRPAVLRAAVLPPGLAAVVQGDSIRVIVDERDRSVHTHGLL